MHSFSLPSTSERRKVDRSLSARELGGPRDARRPARGCHRRGQRPGGIPRQHVQLERRGALPDNIASTQVRLDTRIECV